MLLSEKHQSIVERHIEAHCRHRCWNLWVANARTNHVHVVVKAPSYLGQVVRDQLKANATRGLREHDPQFKDRPVWTTKGDVKLLKTKLDLDEAIQYAGEAQDRMERGK